MKRSQLLRSVAVTAVLATVPLLGFAMKAKPTRLADGLSYTDSVVGKGAMPTSGAHVTVAYTGRLTNGKIFDASSQHGGSFSFVVGQGEVIKGWDEGVATMRVGGHRRLVVPSSLGYGEQGAGDAIPPNATLIFDITLIRIDR